MSVPKKAHRKPALRPIRPSRLAKPNRKLAYFYLAINTICWGAALPLVKPALTYTTPFRYLFYRFVLAVIISLPLLIHYLPKIKRLPWKILKITILEIFGTTIGLGILYLGLQHTTALEASLISTTEPIFVTVAGVVLLRERQELHETIGLIIALVGTFALILIPLSNGLGITHLSLLGNLLITLQNLVVAIYFVLARKYYQGIPKLFVTTISFYVGAVSFFLLSLYQLHFSLPLLLQTGLTEMQNGWVQLAVFFMAIFGSLIGLTTYIRGQEIIEASEASLFWYLQPAVYIPLSMLLLQEKMYLSEVFALVLIFAGVIYAEKRFRMV